MFFFKFKYEVLLKGTKIAFFILLILTWICAIFRLISLFEFNSSKSKVDSVDSHDDSNYLILTVVYLSLIVLFCSIGYIGTLKNSYWIIVIFAVGLSIEELRLKGGGKSIFIVLRKSSLKFCNYIFTNKKVKWLQIISKILFY